MALKKLLNYFIAFQFVISDPEDLESLLAGHKTTLNTKSLLCHLLATLVAKLFHWRLVIFLMKILENFLHSFLFSQWSYLAGTLLNVRWRSTPLACPVLCRRVDFSSMLAMRKCDINLSPRRILTADLFHRRRNPNRRIISRYQVRRLSTYTT